MTVNIVALSLQRKKACLSISYSSCEGHDAYEIICICATKREGHLMIISGIVMSQLISELIQNDGHVEIFTILGVGMDKFGTYEDTKGRSASKDFIIICCFFILAQIIANILLIWGTIVSLLRTCGILCSAPRRNGAENAKMKKIFHVVSKTKSTEVSISTDNLPDPP
ncbi:uncharacterized protein LOC111870803 isoform X5 [Cryptotermes secundus]|uniref:uncharacterized protein LOC111870803 isoform X5 n=1 Tax=Cryptotermes secundus TaxID=105785 RepID=UPI001454B8BC|nr:uncharacterized protein LOC111870803 isoform X5 [Cryptotermes secundus]